MRAELENVSLAKAKSALTLKVFSRGTKVGELQVGRGSLYWWGKHRHKFKRINWGAFADKMDELAYNRKRGA